MKYQSLSIRSFIGAKDFKQSRDFYQKMEFEEVPLGAKMSLFKINENLSFYLQDAYVKDWIENSMLFVEVDDLLLFQKNLLSKNLRSTFKTVRISEIRTEDWGKELFVHDPSGVLWHFGTFNA
jgi:hypothetical protein